jgi:dihydroorotase-like cyclic amidohydrolase
VQTLYLSCLQLAKKLGDVWLAPRWASEAPAALVALQESKGALAAGFDADIVIVDPNGRTNVRPELMRSRQRRGALDGMEFSFAIKDVYLRGESVSRNTEARGRMIRPALIAQ